jgi:hypothetical protein
MIYISLNKKNIKKLNSNKQLEVNTGDNKPLKLDETSLEYDEMKLLRTKN